MAEALSVAASGIAVAQVAAQVGKSIIKLKQLWDDFKDVPSSIGDLLDQIECLDPALWEAENTFTQASLPSMFWNSNLGSRSTVYCRKALVSLTELIDDLTLQLDRPGKLRRKVAIAKVVLKKEQLRSLERRLQNAITMLSLAQSSYLVALTRIQPDIIIQRITEPKPPLLTQTLQDDIQEVQLDISDVHKRKTISETMRLADNEQFEDRALSPRRYTKRKENAVYSIRFRLPMWVCRATWELQSFRSYGNWQFNLRYYNNLPWDSDVFRVVATGTPKDLQMLFASGRASPYDRESRWGDTLLHHAAFSINRPMVKYLLDIGLSPVEVNDDGRAPIQELRLVLLGKDPVKFIADWSFTDELNKLLEAQDAYLDAENTECECRIGLVSKEILRTLQDIECSHHDNTTLQSRLRSLKQVDSFTMHPNVIPDLLRGYWTQELRALCIESMAIFPLIHLVADGLGGARDNLSAEWASLAETVISNTPDIHYVDANVLRTPLMTVIKSSELGSQHRRSLNMRNINRRVTLWLSKVQSSGRDLEEYGRRENEMIMSKELHNECWFRQWNNDDGEEKLTFETKGRIRGYQYGKQPKDWKILWSFPEKSYAADFWTLVEDGPQLMPGAWVEESDDEVEESDDEVEESDDEVEESDDEVEESDVDFGYWV